MKNFGLIGYPLTHSFSPAYFQAKFKSLGLLEYRYDAYPMESVSALRELIAKHQLVGLNVTIPHKSTVMSLLDEVDPVAAEIGAVNTIANRGGVLTGYNTDVTGFTKAIAPHLAPHHSRALILGTGGSSKAVAHALSRLGIAYQFVSRQNGIGILSYTEITKDVMASTDIIVNCTPVGMYPHTDVKPELPYRSLTPLHLLFDLIYNPPVTAFLAEGSKYGAVTLNGQKMLELQADESWRIWNETV